MKEMLSYRCEGSIHLICINSHPKKTSKCKEMKKEGQSVAR